MIQTQRSALFALILIGVLGTLGLPRPSQADLVDAEMVSFDGASPGGEFVDDGDVHSAIDGDGQGSWNGGGRLR